MVLKIEYLLVSGVHLQRIRQTSVALLHVEVDRLHELSVTIALYRIVD